MASQAADSESQASPVKTVIGERFRTTREQRRLSINDVAKDLRLAVSIISAIEADRFAELPAKTYLYGYVRSYARLLGLNADEVIKAYDEIQFEQPQYVAEALKKSQRRVVASKADAKKSSPLAGVMLLFVILLAIPGVFIFSNINLNTVNTDIERVEHTEPPPVELKVDEAAETSLSTPVQSEIQQPDAEPVKPVETSDVSAIPQSEQVQVENFIAPEVTQQAEASQFRFVFEQDCWIEIRDTSDKVLQVNLFRAGNELTLDYNSTIRVFLGNASGVKIFYKGTAYDHSPYIKGRLARFELG